MDKKEMKGEQKSLKEKKSDGNKKEERKSAGFSPKLIGAIADEVSKTLINTLPSMMRRTRKAKPRKTKKIEFAILLDTSAIIDGRIFDIISTGLLNGKLVILASILMEIKHLADSQDTVKRERGRRGLELLERSRKDKKISIVVLEGDDEKRFENLEVDERLIRVAKYHKGKIITCDYNLEKKAGIENVTAININALANYLKVIAVPGESLYIQISHQGKEEAQGVGYMDDGTMIVVENGFDLIGKNVNVVVSRVIQTSTGRILFAKKI
jgi:uncharacterized protein YacL